MKSVKGWATNIIGKVYDGWQNFRKSIANAMSLKAPSREIVPAQYRTALDAKRAVKRYVRFLRNQNTASMPRHIGENYRLAARQLSAKGGFGRAEMAVA